MNVTISELGDAIAQEVVRSVGGAGSEWYSLWQKAAMSVLDLQDELNLSVAGREVLLEEIRLLRSIRDENDNELCNLAETCMELEREVSKLKRIRTDQSKVIRSYRQDMARVRRAMGVRPPRRG